MPLQNVLGELALDTSIQQLVDLLQGGAFGYEAGTAPATIDVPAGAVVKSISVVAAADGVATVVIAGGDTITILEGGGFDERVVGNVGDGADVVIGGAVASYYVSWTVS